VLTSTCVVVPGVRVTVAVEEIALPPNVAETVASPAVVEEVRVAV
jgi:hypothetical protein